MTARVLALLFPGQGSQEVGMGRELAGISRAARATFEAADAALSFPLSRLCFEGPEEELVRTENQQPAILATSVAMLRALEERGPLAPACFAGHSLGEYSALVAAEAMRFEDALPLVRYRAQSMQEAVPEGTGGIAAILGLDDAKLREVCESAAQGEVLEPANLNSPGQVVIAGHRSAVERGMAAAKEKGAKRAVMLPMSAPSHCSLMRPAADKLAARLEAIEIRKPQIPVIHNRFVESFDDPARIRQALVEQLYNPVRWIETVELLGRKGVTRVVECGPGKVLTGLSKRIVPDIEYLSITDTAALEAALAKG
jgi:[acyl-carrier-protein] S-malonyltransferase